MGRDRTGAEQALHACPVIDRQSAQSLGGGVPAACGISQGRPVAETIRQPLGLQAAQRAVNGLVVHSRDGGQLQPVQEGAWPP